MDIPLWCETRGGWLAGRPLVEEFVLFTAGQFRTDFWGCDCWIEAECEGKEYFLDWGFLVYCGMCDAGRIRFFGTKESFLKWRL